MNRASKILLLWTLSLILIPISQGGFEASPLDPARVGAWSQPAPLPHSAVHAILLPSGKVFFFDNQDWQANDYTKTPASLWDPSTDSLTDVTLHDPLKVFCGGHVLLSDGRVLVTGGEQQIAHGLPSTFFFDSWTETWSRGPDMSVGRYYPSPLTLPDGRIVVLAGNDEDGQLSGPVEFLNPGRGESWEVLQPAYRVMENYPKIHVLPTGEVVHTGPERESLFFDPTSGAWRPGPSSAEHRVDGSSVLLAGLGRVLVLGGRDLGGASATAEILELEPEPTWRPTTPLALERRNQNAVLLPDGDVLVVGGANSARIPVQVPELYDSERETWTPMLPQAGFRTYHSIAVLLPDGRVLSAGGDTELGFIPLGPARTMEVYSPPYLFRGPRPVIEDAPDRLGYAGAFRVATPDVDQVDRVVLVRAGSVTHSYDFDQRLVELDFLVAGDGLVAQAPPDGNIAPPGWYLLFLLDAEGVPSVAEMVQVGPPA